MTKAPAKTPRDGGVRVERRPLQRALHVLDWIVSSARDEVGVREISRNLRMSPSTVHRALSTLEGEGFVRRIGADGKYGLGLNFLRLAWRTTRSITLRTIALPLMQELRDDCGETVLLGIYDRDRHEMFFAASVESTEPLRYVVALDEWVPVYRGSSGIAILGQLRDEERDAILTKARSEGVSESGVREIEAECERVRERGYSITHGHRIEGAVGVAAPIVVSEYGVAGDVVITIPEPRFREVDLPRLSSLVMSSAHKIGVAFGG